MPSTRKRPYHDPNRSDSPVAGKQGIHIAENNTGTKQPAVEEIVSLSSTRSSKRSSSTNSSTRPDPPARVSASSESASHPNASTVATCPDSAAYHNASTVATCPDSAAHHNASAAYHNASTAAQCSDSASHLHLSGTVITPNPSWDDYDNTHSRRSKSFAGKDHKLKPPPEQRLREKYSKRSSSTNSSTRPCPSASSSSSHSDFAARVSTSSDSSSRHNASTTAASDSAAITPYPSGDDYNGGDTGIFNNTTETAEASTDDAPENNQVAASADITQLLGAASSTSSSSCLAATESESRRATVRPEDAHGSYLTSRRRPTFVLEALEDTADNNVDNASDDVAPSATATKTAVGALSGHSNSSTSPDEDSIEGDLESLASPELHTFNTDEPPIMKRRADRIKRNEDRMRQLAIKTFGPKERTTPPRKRKSAPRVIVPPRPKSKRKVKETNRLSFGQNGKQQTAKESEQAVKAFFKSDDKLRAGQKGRATAQTMYDDNAEDSKEDSYEYEGDVVKEPLEGVIEEKGEGVIKEKGDYEHPKSLAGFPMATSISLPMPEDCKENHTCTVSTQGTQGSISFPIHDATSTITIAVQKLKSHFPDSFNDQWSTVQAIVEKFIRHQFHDDIASSFQTLQDVSHVRTGRPMVYLELLVDTDGKYSLYIGETGNHKSRIEFKLEEKKKMGTIVALLEVPDHLCSHLDPAVQQLWDLDLPFFRGTTSDKREKMLAKIKRQLVECFFASWIDCHTKHVCEALTNDVPSHFKDVFTFSEDILKELVNFLGKVKDEGKVEHEDPDEEDDDDGTYIGTDFTRLQFVIDHEWKGNSMLATKFNVKKPGLSLKQFLVERLSGKQKIRFEDAVDTCLVQEEFDKLWDKLLPLLKEDIPKNMDEILELLHEFGLLWVSDFNNGYLLRPAKNRMLAQGTREVLKGILDRPKDTITYIQFIQWESLQLHKKDWLDENIPNRIKLGKLFVLLKDSKGKRILVLPGFFRGFLDKLPVHIRVQILNALLLLNEASRRQSLKSDTEAQALTDLVTSFLVQGCGREARANVLPGGLGQNSFPSLSSWSSETQLPSELIATFIHKMDADSFSVKDVRDVLNAYKVKFGVPKSKSIPVEPSQSTPAVQSKSQSIPGAQSKKTESKSQYISAKPSPATQPKSQSTPAAPSQSVPKATREEISELAKSNPDSIELHFEKRQVEETVQCLEGLQG